MGMSSKEENEFVTVHEKDGGTHVMHKSQFEQDEIDNPIPQASEIEKMQVDRLVRQDRATEVMNNGKEVDLDINTISSIQPKIRRSTLQYLLKNPGEAGKLPLVITVAGNNIVVDGNHRIVNAINNNKHKIRVKLSKHTDYYF